MTPGLVDTHMHFAQTAFFDGRPDALDIRDAYPFSKVAAYQKTNPQRYYDSYLCSGVTAIYDVGGFSWSIGLQESTEANPKAPHVAAAGPLITPATQEFFNLPFDKVLVYLDSEQTGVTTVEHLSELGSTGIKLWQIPVQNEEYMGWLESVSETAAKEGNHLIAHATSLVQAKAAIRLGTKLLVHSVGNTGVDDEFIQMAKENGVMYNPTLVVSSGYTVSHRAAMGIEPFAINDPNGCMDSKSRELYETADQFKDHPRYTDALRSRLETYDPEINRLNPVAMENLKKVYDAGIPVVVGTDAGNPGTFHGISIYEEMEAMQQAGIPAEEIIPIATKNGAEAMRRSDDFGTLEAGKFGDLILMDEDPSVNIRNMRSITHVMIKGKLMDVKEVVKE